VRRQVCSPTTFSRGALVCVHASPQRCPRSPSAEQRADVRWTSSKMTGATRRAFQAEMPLQDCAGNARVAEAVCGWGRHPVALGRAERRPGGMCLGAPSACSGRKRWEDTQPQAAQALRQRAEAQAPHAPTLRTSLASPRLTAAAALDALRGQGYLAAQLPAPSTMAAVCNRLGFRLRQGVKATPHKKMPETDAMVDHSKKKIPQQRYRSTSNACVSLVKPPCPAAILRAAVSPGVIPTRVTTTWGARRTLCRVESWRKIPGNSA